MDKQWAVSVNGALNAYFNQPDGTSRPGAGWSIGLDHNQNVYNTLVRTYLWQAKAARCRSQRPHSSHA